MTLLEAITLRRQQRITHPVEAGWAIHDEASSLLADAYMEALEQIDRREQVDEEWLADHGFEWDEALVAWELYDVEGGLPLLLARSSSYPNVWGAHIDGTPWPSNIHLRGQVYDLCRALENPLVNGSR